MHFPKSLKLRILEEKVLRISLKLNFTPTTSSYYGLIAEKNRHLRRWYGRVDFASFLRKFHSCRHDRMNTVYSVRDFNM